MSVRVFDEMVGKMMVSASSTGDEMIFVDTDGNRHTFYHDQDCCESVGIDDICGDLNDLVGSPIVMAEEVDSDGREVPPTPEYCDSETWTFYRFATAKGFVTVRWYGTSNGYYSESVSYRFEKSANSFNA